VAQQCTWAIYALTVLPVFNKYKNPVASALHLLRVKLFFMLTGVFRADIPFKRGGEKG
jgi:hypothetical protein